MGKGESISHPMRKGGRNAPQTTDVCGLGCGHQLDDPRHSFGKGRGYQYPHRTLHPVISNHSIVWESIFVCAIFKPKVP